MNLGINEKRALITGADNGLARSIARDLAAEGVLLALVSGKRARAQKIFQAIGSTDKGHALFLMDLIKPGQINTLQKKIERSFGDVNIIVHCMDSYEYDGSPYLTLEQWRRIFRVNLEVAIEVNNAFIPSMKKSSWGRIVHVGSGVSMEHAATVSYCTARAALTAYTRSMGRVLALEADNVVMSAVLTGAMMMDDGYWANVGLKSPQKANSFLAENSPTGRFGRPEEVSPMVVLLCAAQATYCHGSIVPVDGGQARHFYHLGGSLK